VEKEFVAVFNAYKDDIYRLCLSYTKNRHDTDDITQNVFVKLHKHLGSLGDEQHIKKWLVKVAVNECKSHFTSSWRKRMVPITREVEEIPAPNHEENELLQIVLALPKKYSLAIHLYYYEDYKISEIAEILGEKETTIQTRLARARSMLKGIIEKEDRCYEKQ
jgi:RNA polymerase sigma-70 factor (ECF subfamily)